MAALGPGMSDGRVRVLIADDDPLVRSGLSMILHGDPGLLVVGEAADGVEVARAVPSLTPDVVLMDIRMPRLDGLAATEALRKAPDPPQVIVLTTFDTDEYVLRALRAGAAGFLLKDTAPAQIVRAVHQVAAGEATLSPTIIRRLIDQVTMPGSREADARRVYAQGRLDQFTDREREVAVAVGRGLSNAEIAGTLHMSVATVKAYVSRILSKADLQSRVQLALLVHDAGARHP